ncbi:conserved Plasmodium protein, unknown function [Plasmodium berghei]|uniref:PH domain-containing protein n=2 Tax=Plasmodium berghei TaxID=5821 RepID=A0A509AFS2_PLABA|nr:PH domain-containing protein [Plasmodium berghei ANKA]CXI04649.1 conserved Plasmodium protein, unknown function [Plasmodium berghei]SCL92285.1 conserved Plasmodium protein, unknown function [Plasmodium berghei]SCM15632.1 conserved Plasmodium protein, unknown function [Plasmodium berghei]SCM17424.1 conserved Plasmodium protein, unknown function [Plasmodium berghei]SCN22727.1 conserved Plasmodium protein, unknown function [Plasmodium berghei]|eukprot:XP_034420229.1 PH domain-containing protein [Plasmodium berghei ANKA]
MNLVHFILPILFLQACVVISSPLFFNKNLDKWTKELIQVSKNEFKNLKEMKELINRKYCGESLKHLAGLVLDKSDKDAKLIIEGSIESNRLIFKLGNIKEKEINIKDIILPIETLSHKCINIRQINENKDSTVLCLANKVLRNFWTNSITDAVLCKITKTKGKLPEYNDSIQLEETNTSESNDLRDSDAEQEDNQKTQENIEIDGKTKKKNQIKKKLLNEEFEDDEENQQKGLQLRISKSKSGYPKIKINGENIDEIKERSEKEINQIENSQKDQSSGNEENDNDM